MRSILVLSNSIRKLHNKQIDEFIWPLINKILPQFNDLDQQADSVMNKNEDAYQLSSDDFDPSDIAEKAFEKGLEHFNMLKLGKYIAISSWHATLFEFYFQQMRLYLFRELSHSTKVNFNKFCIHYNEIIKLYSFHNFDLKSLSSWNKISELQLLCNVIKHGDGRSSDELRKISPKLFKYENNINFMDLYKTTLLEVTLAVNENTLLEYTKDLHKLWDELPEECYSNEFQP